ncbi:RS20 [Enterospora canceri]|uniref:RS20 n=1 Tax=Enterospora canceri TaxID=1081671 RepID=A0A1Y1S6S9_9MICR|nr:RS20 [Enterospora canceri]
MEDSDKKDEIAQEHIGEVRNITVNLSSPNKKSINLAAREFYEYVKELKENIDMPEIVPTAEAVFTTRKSPCGNGTATYTRHTMRVYQRKFIVSLHDSNITKVTDFLKSVPARAQLMINQ